VREREIEIESERESKRERGREREREWDTPNVTYLMWKCTIHVVIKWCQNTNNITD
jgi:hypothetical protein